MSEKREHVNSSDNKVVNRSVEEREHVFSDDIEEKSTFEKLKENKKITMPFFAVLIVGMLVYLVMPSREKEEPKKKTDVQTSDSINLDLLENKKSEDEELNNGYQSNGNQQDYFAYDDSNLQTYEAPPNLDMPKKQ